jgi:hypothetical protein
MAAMALAITAVDDAAWDAFCASSPSAWFWHTTAWRDYTLAYSPDLGTRSLAFAVLDGSAPVAVVPLTLEQTEGGPVFTFGGGACWAPALAPQLAPAQGQAVLRRALDHVEELAAENAVVRAAFLVSPLVPDAAGTGLRWAAAAVRAGYLDTTRVSQVVDLTAGEDELLRAMSKGHRADVKRAGRTIEVDVAAATDDEMFTAYQQMHQRAAGRVTRPQRTFDLMREWLSSGHAVLFAGRRDDHFLGFSYILRYRNGAYYASAANDPDESGHPVGHALQWRAMTWLRKNGVTTYELGAQPFGLVPHDEASEKELAIARFKRGFGGIPVPVFGGERYWGADALTAVRDRLERFTARLGPEG